MTAERLTAYQEEFCFMVLEIKMFLTKFNGLTGRNMVRKGQTFMSKVICESVTNLIFDN
jgi:hypothetical protein